MENVLKIASFDYFFNVIPSGKLQQKPVTSDEVT